MNFAYIFYECMLVPFILFSLWITKEKVLKDEPLFVEYIFILLLILIIWCELAIYLKQWYFPFGVNVGIYIGHHPLETYIEAIVTPIFILSIWELVKRRK